MKKTQVDIVVVTYNSRIRVANLLSSLTLANEYISSITIIENNSPQKFETKRVIENLRQENSQLNIRFILSKKNLGFGAACNRGARYARSKYLLFLNPDTVVNKNSIKTLIAHASKGNYDLAGGLCQKNSNEIHRTAVRRPNLLIGLFEFSNLGKIFNIKSGTKNFYYINDNLYSSNIDKSVDAVSGAYLLVKTSSFRKLKGFDEDFFMYLEDVDLGVRANEFGMKVYFCPHSIIWHQGGASSDNKFHISHQAWFESRKTYFRKHYGLIINLILQPIYSIEEYLLRIRLKLNHLIR